MSHIFRNARAALCFLKPTMDILTSSSLARRETKPKICLTLQFSNTTFKSLFQYGGLPSNPLSRGILQCLVYFTNSSNFLKRISQFLHKNSLNIKHFWDSLHKILKPRRIITTCTKNDMF